MKKKGYLCIQAVKYSAQFATLTSLYRTTGFFYNQCRISRKCCISRVVPQQCQHCRQNASRTHAESTKGVPKHTMWLGASLPLHLKERKLPFNKKAMHIFYQIVALEGNISFQYSHHFSLTGKRPKPFTAMRCCVHFDACYRQSIYTNEVTVLPHRARSHSQYNCTH